MLSHVHNTRQPRSLLPLPMFPLITAGVPKIATLKLPPTHTVFLTPQTARIARRGSSGSVKDDFIWIGARGEKFLSVVLNVLTKDSSEDIFPQYYNVQALISNTVYRSEYIKSSTSLGNSIRGVRNEGTMTKLTSWWAQVPIGIAPRCKVTSVRISYINTLSSKSIFKNIACFQVLPYLSFECQIGEISSAHVRREHHNRCGNGTNRGTRRSTVQGSGTLRGPLRRTHYVPL